MVGGAGRWRQIAVYLGLVFVGGVAVVGVLFAGRDLRPTPTLPANARTDGAAAACFGDVVSIVQSGVFVDVGRVDDRNTETTSPLGSGRLRGDGTGTIAGQCGAGPNSGADFRLNIDTSTAQGAGRAEGRLAIDDGEPQTIELVGIGENASSGTREKLTGSALSGRLFLAIAVVVILARAVGVLFRRIGQPPVIGEILAGILLGPSLLGDYLPAVSHVLFPTEITAILQPLSQLGLILFMFLVGLEVDRKLLRTSLGEAVMISHVSIILPFVVGAVASLGLYPLLGQGEFTPFALFLGAAMAITAFPVLARILTDTGLAPTRLGALVIACAAVDDVTAWGVLAVVVAVVNSTGPGEVLRTVALSAVFVATVFLVFRPNMARFIRADIRRNERLSPLGLSVILGAVLIAAWATEVIGIHAIFGAFIIGLVMPRKESFVAAMHDRLGEIVSVLLLPIFFVVVGLSTRFGLVDRFELWVIAGVVIIVAIFGKLVGSMLAARVMGNTWRRSAAVGVLMNTRGLTELVILSVGRSLGVVTPALFTVMVLMALVTTCMAAPLLKVFYPASLETEGLGVEP